MCTISYFCWCTVKYIYGSIKKLKFGIVSSKALHLQTLNCENHRKMKCKLLLPCSNKTDNTVLCWVGLLPWWMEREWSAQRMKTPIRKIFFGRVTQAHEVTSLFVWSFKEENINDIINYHGNYQYSKSLIHLAFIYPDWRSISLHGMMFYATVRFLADKIS